MENSPAWSLLADHYQLIKNIHLNDFFKQDQTRGARYYLEESGIYLDYSKNNFSEQTLKLLLGLAEEKHLKERINALINGEKVNRSEGRAALHTSLRDPNNINGINTDTFNTIQNAQQHMFSLLSKVESGDFKNRKNKAFKHLVCLGIGGSYLGPKFIIDALQNKQRKTLSVHFVANIDPEALEQKLSVLNIEECLFFIASKSFSTLETLQNAKQVKLKLKEIGLNENELNQHFIAATENIDAAIDFGCREQNILPIWDFVGGRFSLWSSIGFPIAVALGKQNFLDLLAGAHEMDRHFIETDFDKNMPVILALIAIWYQNFFDAPSRAVIPYSHNLKTLPAYLQQLEMESLGKSVTQDNKVIDYSTGAIIWGSEGSNSQHAFHQLLHQGTHLIPCDFLVCKYSRSNQAQQDILFSQCVAQSRALMIGNEITSIEKQHEGNRPSNTLVLEDIQPKTLGALIALYEHKTFVQGSLLDINPFDQWGVELGKVIGNDIEIALKTDTQLDSSTDSLIDHYQK
jgi:glucose-6-phosphate isomerase